MTDDFGGSYITAHVPNKPYSYIYDAGRILLNIYIDLSKAFDTLYHTILLEKLRNYGIRDTELQLIQIIYQIYVS